MLMIYLIIFIVFFCIYARNRIKILKIKVDEAQSDLEIYLVKRYDILTESAKVAKRYMEHEKDVLVNITQIRKGMDINETEEIIKEQETFMNKLFATAENYPELYSNELFKNLQSQITETNEHLSASKRLYNSNVSIYNQYIVAFPVNIIASVLNETKKDFLKDDKIEEKKEVNLDL